MGSLSLGVMIFAVALAVLMNIQTTRKRVSEQTAQYIKISTMQNEQIIDRLLVDAKESIKSIGKLFGQIIDENGNVTAHDIESLNQNVSFESLIYVNKHGIGIDQNNIEYAFADATVPKVNVVIGKAFGSAYVTMNSKAVGADMVYAWPDAEIGMMDANQAAKIMYADADAATIREKAAEYKNLQSSPLSAAKRGYVDTIIEAADTRKYVIGAFEMLFTKREDRPAKKHGTV